MDNKLADMAQDLLLLETLSEAGISRILGTC